jgi:RimJ/RimL family protein N-acetyltransferase
LQRIEERDSVYGGKFGGWALETKDAGRIAGSVLLKPLPDSENIEVGWHLARHAWGNGYATEAATEAIRYGLEEVGLEVIYAVVFPDNTRSLKVCERLGMSYIGLTDDYYDKRLCLFAVQLT